MAVDRVFTARDIQELLDKNAAPPFGGRYSALIMAVTGIKQKRTLERKVRPLEVELGKVFRELYSRMRNPDLN